MEKLVVAAGRMGPMWGGARLESYIDIHPTHPGPESGFLIRTDEAEGTDAWDHGFEAASVRQIDVEESYSSEYTYEDHLADLGDHERALQKEGWL